LIESYACRLGLVIAVSGLPGSGKTTLAKLLARNLGLKYISLGMIFREIAKERGLSIEELSKLAESDASIDYLIDGKAREEAKKGCTVIDGHISAWILKDLAHLRIVVTAPLSTRAKRIAMRDGKSIDEAMREVKLREDSERRRYKKFYGINIDDLSDVDLVINTEKFNVDETLEIALKAVEMVIKSLKG